GCVVIAGATVLEGAAGIVNVAALLVVETWLASVTMARYSDEPAAVKLLRVRVSVLLPTMPLPSLRSVKVTPWSVDICQCTVRGAVPPLSATLKDTEPDWPTVAVVSCGCVVIAGAA